MLRLISSIFIGIAIAFGLFVIMAKLIDGGSKSVQDDLERIVVEINTTPPDSKSQKLNREPPPPPKPPKQPPKPKVPTQDVETKVDNINPGLDIPTVDVGNLGAQGLAGPGNLAREGDAVPILRFEPEYPAKASRDGIEGWVELSFDINTLGEVENVKVINAKPKRVFDRAARKALRQWKYNPKVVDGKAMVQTGLKVKLDFSLEE